MKFRLVFLCLFTCSIADGQGITKRALFLGNSYTAVNNLPQMVAAAALSTGDTLLIDSNAPGGYTLQGHCANATSLSKIRAGNWDYVVLQEQSQLPSFPDGQVNTAVFPYAHKLDSIINADNPCSETVFYMTWGRKNGDWTVCPSWPPVCTYTGMDSLLNLRYRTMAENNNAVISPVGAVWKYIRQHFPQIELYQADESHPSVAGTYAAACCFYTALFKKDPTLITFNATLTATDAADIKTAARFIVYDSLINWHIGEYGPSADFNYADSGNGKIFFFNNSLNATGYIWDFGDGTTSTELNPSHYYANTGTYNAVLFASNCAEEDSLSQTIKIAPPENQNGYNNMGYLHIYPNPAKNWVNLKTVATLQGAVYIIYNSAGQRVLTGIINSSNEAVNINKLPAGIYFLRLEGDLKRSYKLIKQ